MSARKPLAGTFGKIVRELRDNMPQVVLANFAGVHLNRLAVLEAGMDEPTLEEIFRLAIALDLKPSELVERTVSAAGSKGP